MLINFENGKEVKDVWYKKEYDVWKDKLEKLDKKALENIKADIKKHLEKNEVNVTSWMPGKKWEGTPYYPIYEAIGDVDAAAMCFGLIVQECIIEDVNKWSFTKMEDIKGTAYFRLKN